MATNKKTVVIVSFVLLMTLPVIAGHSVKTVETQSESIKTSFMNNPKVYYDVRILLKSNVFEVTGIDGFHSSDSGIGYDDSITLFGSHISLFGIFVIWNTSEIKELNMHGGWINTKLEIFGYNGWMKGQYKLTSLKMFGQCDQIKITTYRD